MTLEQFILWEAGLGVPMLVGFGVWLVTQNTKRQVELVKIEKAMAEQAAKFVTYEYMQRVELWRAEIQREFTEVRKELQGVALAVARMEGASGGHTGG